MVSSKGEKSFICGVCELSFSDSSTLKIHVGLTLERNSSSVRFVIMPLPDIKKAPVHSQWGRTLSMCDLQCYIFPVIKPQNAHEDTHSACRADLKRHLSTHTGKKQFHCEICEYTTMEKSKLVNHIVYTYWKEAIPM